MNRVTILTIMVVVAVLLILAGAVTGVRAFFYAGLWFCVPIMIWAAACKE